MGKYQESMKFIAQWLHGGDTIVWLDAKPTTPLVRNGDAQFDAHLNELERLAGTRHKAVADEPRG